MVHLYGQWGGNIRGPALLKACSRLLYSKESNYSAQTRSLTEVRVDGKQVARKKLPHLPADQSMIGLLRRGKLY